VQRYHLIVILGLDPKKYALRMGLQKAQRHKRRIIIASENEHVNVECQSQCWIITDEITVRQLAAID
jgi:hypothetical protein